MDGTLVDSLTPIRTAISKTLEEFGHGPLTQESAKYFVGVSLSEALRHWTPDPAPMVRRYQEIYIRDCAGGCGVFPGILEMLDKLKGNCELGIITLNANDEARQVLGQVGLKKYFEHIFGDDAERSPHRIKPHPQHYFYALNKMGLMDDDTYLALDGVDDLRKSFVKLDTTKVVFVGDSQQDMWGSARAGIASIGAAWRKDRPGLERMLREAGAGEIAGTPGELVELLGRRGII